MQIKNIFRRNGVGQNDVTSGLQQPAIRLAAVGRMTGDATYNRRTSCTGVMQMSIRNRFLLAAAGLLPACVTLTAQSVEANYDVIIRNGHVVDGTGSPWYTADVAVKDGRIAAIGRLTDAKAARTIDAHGMVVAPGFIDMLGQ